MGTGSSQMMTPSGEGGESGPVKKMPGQRRAIMPLIHIQKPRRDSPRKTRDSTRAFVGRDPSSIYKEVGADAAVGVRIRKLRGGRFQAIDRLTGLQDNPAGFSQDLGNGTAFLTVQDDISRWTKRWEVQKDLLDLPAAVLEGGDLHDVAKWLVCQFGPLCYLAAPVNLLLSMPFVRNILDSALLQAQRDMPDVYADYLSHGVFPSSIALPAGLAFLQLYKMLRERPHLDTAPVLRVLEMRLKRERDRPSYTNETLRQLLRALGFTFETNSGVRDVYSLPELVKDFCLWVRHSHFTDAMSGNLYYPGASHMGYLLTYRKNEHTNHVVAALRPGMVYDSETLSPSRVPWETMTPNQLATVVNGHDTEALRWTLVFVADRLVQDKSEATTAALGRRLLAASMEHAHPEVPKMFTFAEVFPARRSEGVRVELVRGKQNLQAIWSTDDGPTVSAIFEPYVGPNRKLTVTWLERASPEHPDYAQFTWDAATGALERIVVRASTGELQDFAEDASTDFEVTRGKFMKIYPNALHFLEDLPEGALRYTMELYPMEALLEKLVNPYAPA